MHSDHPEVRPHRKNSAVRFEGMLSKLMVAAIVVLAAVMIYGLVTTGGSTPSWMH